MRVKKSCARAALVTPEGGMWYHLMSSIYATFYVMPKGLVEGDGVFEVLARADYYVRRFAWACQCSIPTGVGVRLSAERGAVFCGSGEMEKMRSPIPLRQSRT